MLTGHGSLESAVEALRQGAHDYLFKPCKTVELRESIRVGLMNRHQQMRQRELLTQLEQHLSSSLAGVRATIEETTPPPTRKTSKSKPQPPVVPPIIATRESEMEQNRFIQHDGLIVDLTRHVITMNNNYWNSALLNSICWHT